MQYLYIYIYIYIYIHIIFQKIDNIYEDKNILHHREIHKFKNIFSHHIGVKLEINKENTQAFTNIYKLKTRPNNSFVKKEIKINI